MDIKNTATLMASSDYKDRFKAEYAQLSIRTEKLKSMLERLDAGTLPFTPDTPKDMLEGQLTAMTEYLRILGERARIENVDL